MGMKSAVMLANRYEPRHCLARDISKTGKWTACSPDKRTKRPDAARGTIGQHASMIICRPDLVTRQLVNLSRLVQTSRCLHPDRCCHISSQLSR
jgi:hypothetical protein